MIKSKGMIVALVLFFAVSSAWAMKGGDHGSHGDMSGDKMDHGSMAHDKKNSAEHFKYVDDSNGVKAVFQVMSLESMKMKDPEGKTHHIMVSLSKNSKQLKQAKGEIEVTSPSGKKQTGKLMPFGGGMYAANFTFDEVGDWGVTCKFSEQGEENTKHFNYQHH